jgi:SHS2 domain-containing protein
MLNDARDPGFEVLDHTSEVTLRLRAPDLPGLVAQATEGFLSFVPRDRRGEVTGGTERFEIDGGDPAATLVEWINELVFHAEAESWLPVEATVESIGASGARIRARRLELSEPFVLVKAATLHDAEIRDIDGGLEVDITLDI